MNSRTISDNERVDFEKSAPTAGLGAVLGGKEKEVMNGLMSGD